MFLIHRSLFSAVLIPHEEFTPRRMYTPPHEGVQRGVTPSEGSPSGGKRAPIGGSRAKPLKEKLPCKCIL
jgi:hypothetical protein